MTGHTQPMIDAPLQVQHIFCMRQQLAPLHIFCSPLHVMSHFSYALQSCLPAWEFSRGGCVCQYLCSSLPSPLAITSSAPLSTTSRLVNLSASTLCHFLFRKRSSPSIFLFFPSSTPMSGEVENQRVWKHRYLTGSDTRLHHTWKATACK